MKNNWIQYLSLVLCTIMLIFIIVQGKRLDEYQHQLNFQMQSLKNDVDNDIQSVRYYIDAKLENADRIIRSFNLKPAGIDPNSRCIKADVSIVLKEWHTDTKVVLIATIGQEKINVDMNGDGAGVFVGNISLPVEENNEVFLSTQISGGGLVKQEELGGWGDVSMLLPLQIGGRGWSGPEYRNGVLSSQFSVTISSFANGMMRVYDEQGIPASVQKPEFHVYKNGELEQTISAIACFPEDNIRIAAGLEPELHEESKEITYSVGNEWSIECKNGDIIDIHFICQDEYGLGYDFFFQSWKTQSLTNYNNGAGNVTSESNGSEALKLFWQ